MPEKAIQFLDETEDVACAIKQIVLDPEVSDIFIAGPTLRVIMDAVFTTLDSDGVSCDTYLILPALTGSEYLGSSFLYQLYRLSSKIRISPKAVHCMVCARKTGMLISPGASLKDPHLCATLISDAETAEQMYQHCEQLFKGGLCLRLTQE